jgi:hypothetical protein
MMIISTTTIIAGAVVVLLAVLGSLINPFLRSLRFQKTETASYATGHNNYMRIFHRNILFYK